MSRTIILIVLICLIYSIFSPPPARAQWTPGGITIAGGSGIQNGHDAAAGEDGNFFVTWEDWTSGTKVYVQKVSASGELLWTSAGIAVASDTLTQRHPRVVSDSNGGCIVAWIGHGTFDYYAFAQRIDSSGNLQWGSSGMRICTADTDQNQVDLVGAGSDGAIFFFCNNYSGSPTSTDIFAQRISLAGSRQWLDTAISICNASNSQGSFDFSEVCSGEVIIAWEDYRTGTMDADIYAQKIDISGVIAWASNGVLCTGSSGDHGWQTVITDGQGGFWLAFETFYDSTWWAIATRFDSSGNQTVFETSFASDFNIEHSTPEIIPDGTGGLIGCWYDYRDNFQLYAQRLSSKGYRLWDSNGVEITTDSTSTYPFGIITDGSGGAILSWKAMDSDALRAQRVDALGNIRWADQGVPFSETSAKHKSPVLLPTGDRGAVAVYYSAVNGYDDVFAQRLDRYGHWGFPNPSVFDTRDVPGDEGGSVLLSWLSSYLDAEPYVKIDHYSVWRMLDEAVAAPYLTGEKNTVNLDELEIAEGPAVRIMEESSTAWEWIDDVAAVSRTEYSYAAPTYCDSMAGQSCIHHFQVIAHSADPAVYWMSEEMPGYSVDNLAPDTLLGLAGAQHSSPDGLKLQWNPNTEEDLSHYNVYRNDGSDFQPSESNLLKSVTTEYAIDDSWSPGAGAYFRVAAVDIHGNIGPSTLLSPGDITATELQAFSASVRDEAAVISWRLKKTSERMEFEVLRAKGENGKFISIPDAEISSEEMNFSFTDRSILPGTEYRYRVNVTDEEGTRTLFETSPVHLPARELTLHQNRPNPFNPRTTISYYLPSDCPVKLEVYNVAGRRVTTLVDAVQSGGPKSVNWNGRSDRGERVASGVYFYRLAAEKKTITRKMILLK